MIGSFSTFDMHVDDHISQINHTWQRRGQERTIDLFLLQTFDCIRSYTTLAINGFF